MIILKSCLNAKAIHVTEIQESTSEISKNLEQELTYLKQNLAVGIFLKLHNQNSYVEPNSLNLTH